MSHIMILISLVLSRTPAAKVSSKTPSYPPNNNYSSSQSKPKRTLFIFLNTFHTSDTLQISVLHLTSPIYCVRNTLSASILYTPISTLPLNFPLNKLMRL